MKFLSKRHILSTFLLVSLLTGWMPLKAEVIIHSSIDSTTIVMGDRTMMHFEVLKDAEKGAIVDLPEKGKEYHGVEIIEATIDSTKHANGRSVINYDYLIQAFDPGMVTIPGIGFTQGGPDTLRADVITLKVLEVDLDTLTTINPMEGVASVKAKWYDVVPDWWYWVVIAIVAIALGFVLFTLFKKNGKTLLPHKKVIPPYDLAIGQLEELRNMHLPEQGHDKEYYTRLTDILRQYLEGRFGINAMEMTSTQILDTIRANEETRLPGKSMKDLLSIADFVKFAKVRPLPEDNVKSFNWAKQFVEDTKPVEVPEGNSKEKEPQSKDVK